MRLGDLARRAGYRLNTFEHLGSTNDEASARALVGDRGRLWIVADRQSAGRGRQGRPWMSLPGNLLASVLLIDAVCPERASQLSFVAGVALVEAIGRAVGRTNGITLKWPNDVLLRGAKIAGVLVETLPTPARAFATVIGFGVNCRVHPDGLAYPASDLSILGPDAPDREAVFTQLSECLVEVLGIWQGGRRFDAVRDMWLARAVPPGTVMTVNREGGRVAGRFNTMDAQGRLVLEAADGPLMIDVGDVALAERSADIGRQGSR